MIAARTEKTLHVRTTTTVEIVLADAAVWARDYSSASGSSIADFDILLVDPPRQGLDERVCRMAIEGSFQHFLYISCGRDALVRDLDLLSNDFEVVDCTLLDLFPQTDAVESLVHLQRRKTNAKQVDVVELLCSVSTSIVALQNYVRTKST